MKDPEKPLDLSESKTGRKKHMLFLQKIGETLVELSDAQLAKIPLDEQLSEAIIFARTLPKNESRRRHFQFIGKLMRHVEIEPIQQALDKVLLKSQQGRAQFHQVERWREQLIAEGDAILQKFLDAHPHADSQHLRQLVRKAQQDVRNEKNSGASTELFRYLKTIIDENPTD